MVPLRDILNDIKDVLSARGARLPESNTEVDEILRRMKDTTIDAPQSQVDDLVLAQPPIKEAEATSGSSNRMFCTQCGSGEHTREICEVKNSSSGDGVILEEALAPVVAAPHTPNRTWTSVKGQEVVWYCSNCGQGPTGSWQNCCASCNHVRCAGCTVETSK
jgi:hypothetical protein